MGHLQSVCRCEPPPSLTATARALKTSFPLHPLPAFRVSGIPAVPTPGPEPGTESARLSCGGCRAGTVVIAAPDGQRLLLIATSVRKGAP